MHVTTEPIWNGLNQLKERGVKLRVVTEITNDNISYKKNDANCRGTSFKGRKKQLWNS
jgi:hypothetical protein